MRLQGKYIMSTLNDMKDYQSLRMGQFRKSMILFNLRDSFEDIKEMIKYKAEQNNNIINFDPIFKQNDDIATNFVRQIQYERIRKNFDGSLDSIENHPLLCHLQNIINKG
jgi:hypothetical protein